MQPEPTYFDSHAHVNFAAFAKDRDQVISDALSEGVWHTNVGTNLKTSQSAVDLAEQYDEGVYAIVGLHPVHTTELYHDTEEVGEGKGFASRGERFDELAFQNLAKHPKVVGIGETGLDYFRNNKANADKQRSAFESQIQLALEAKKPLMLHVRPSEGSLDAYHDVYEVLSAYRNEFLQDAIANLHFFAGTPEIAQKFLDLGCTISFTGVITFASMYRELVAYVPLDRMLSETDCPYVSPAPHRGSRNEPKRVRHVVEYIAGMRPESRDQVVRQLLKNARTFFGV